MKSRLTVIFLSIISISFSQINFIQDNNITVVKNDRELVNPWTGGMNFC